MKTYKNLTILGTSHIAKQSIKEVYNHITQNKPNIVALELDFKRFKALTSKKQPKISIINQGIRIYLLNLVGAYIEKKLAKIVKTKPGQEMKTAISLAKKHKLEIALIDQDISITLKRLIKAITLKEKLNFITDILKAPFTKQKIKFDLTKVPPQSLINKIIKQTKKRYPSIHRVLIQERNNYMAKNLNNLITNNKDKKIFAIVGAGHEQDLIKIIKKQKGEKKSRYVLLKPKSRTS